MPPKLQAPVLASQTSIRSGSPAELPPTVWKAGLPSILRVTGSLDGIDRSPIGTAAADDQGAVVHLIGDLAEPVGETPDRETGIDDLDRRMDRSISRDDFVSVIGLLSRYQRAG